MEHENSTQDQPTTRADVRSILFHVAHSSVRHFDLCIPCAVGRCRHMSVSVGARCLGEPTWVSFGVVVEGVPACPRFVSFARPRRCLVNGFVALCRGCQAGSGRKQTWRAKAPRAVFQMVRPHACPSVCRRGCLRVWVNVDGGKKPTPKIHPLFFVAGHE